MSVAIAINESDIVEEAPVWGADDPIFALLDEEDAAEGQTEYDRLRALGAPAHLSFDLSDAAHDCVSDDSGTCASCAGGGTPALPTKYNRAKYL